MKTENAPSSQFPVPSSSEPHYSPHLRTALVLTGSGTAGAYHAGVLGALQEAGVKIDLVAGCGVGVVGAMFAAVEPAPRLTGRPSASVTDTAACTMGDAAGVCPIGRVPRARR